MNNRILTQFGFMKMPFAKTLPVADIFKSSMTQQLLAMFELGLATEDIMLVSGDIGCGKSVTLRLFIDSIDGNTHHPVYLKGNRMNAAYLYRAVLMGLKIEPPFRLSAAKMLYEKSIPEFRKKPVIILDDVQDLTDDALVEIKNLVSFDADSQNRVCVIMAGQTEIADKLKFSMFTPLRQRIRLLYQGNSMGLEETCRYIQHHLSVCGKNSSLFTDDAMSEIFKRSNGIPRLIDRECYRAIIAAFTKGKDIIEPSMLPSLDLNE